MKKEATVHRLPTEDRTLKIWLDNDTGKLLYDPVGVMNCTPQHLYATTDELPKEGDWVIGEHGLTNNWNSIEGFEEHYRKIIATTDPKLHVIESEYESIHLGKQTKYKIDVPQIPQSFIEKYCKAGGIDKVMVEYDSQYIGRYTTDGIDWLPKTDSNNCIIIPPVEESLLEECLNAIEFLSDEANTNQYSELIKNIKENL